MTAAGEPPGGAARRDPDRGCPKGADAALRALSDPPRFTACPNPHLAAFVARHGRPAAPGGDGESAPFEGDLRSRRRHPVYRFHPYHTKVPPEVVRQLIEHYTRPGELVLDVFCGSGMTGVAAREAGRHAVLVDLSPAATFIAAVNTRAHDADAAVAHLERIVAESERRWGRLYRTTGDDGRPLVVNHFVWADVFTCPDCDHAFPFFPHGVVHHGNKVETRKAFPCPACGATLNVRRVRRVIAGGRKQRALVWVDAGVGRGRIGRPPTDADRALAAEADRIAPSAPVPRDPIDPDGYSAKLAQLGDKAITDVSRLLSPRNLIVFADLWARAGAIDDPALRNLCRATLTSVFTVISERQGYFGGGGGMSGNLYMPIVRMEKNVYAVLRRKLPRLRAAEAAKAGATGEVIVSTQSAARLDGLPDDSVDFVYVDPPFGANIIYSEVNLALESWLGARTAGAAEAVIDPARGFDAARYGALLRRCFGELYRVLKPGRWMSVQFHNADAAVWNVVHEALGASGFVIARASVLDKGTTTILIDIRPGAARDDLIIAAYKPARAVERAFRLEDGSPAAAWAFVADHLAHLPLRGGGPDPAAPCPDRRAHRLYGALVRHHLDRGRRVPLSAAAFYRGLDERFERLDDAFFLPRQAARYREGATVWS